MSEIINAPARLVYRTAHLALRAYWLVRKPETHGALVALWHEEHVLLIQSSYRLTYSLPGGYVKSGEDPKDAARRELREELELVLPPEKLRHAWHGSMPFENRTDTLDIFEADIAKPFHVAVNYRELIWSGWKTSEQAREMRIVPHLRAYLEERASKNR